MRFVKRLLTFVLIVLETVISVSLSNAAVYYVDPVVGNDSNVGSIEAPWQTIQRAVKYGWPVQFRKPGDIVYLRGGLYRGNTNGIDIGTSVGSGTSDAPITIKAYPGETPIVCDQTSPYRGVLIKCLSWWVFDGITYSNCYQSVWQESCTNFLWKNCTFGWMPQGDSGYSGFAIWGDSQFTTVSNCVFIKWGKITATGNDHGVSISIGNETGDNPMWYSLFVSNQFYYGGHDHFQLNSAYNVIRGNLFVNAPWMLTNSTSSLLASLGGVVPEPNLYGAYGNRHTKPGDGGTNQIDMRNVWEYNKFLYSGPPPDDFGAFGLELGTRQSIYRFNVIAFSLAAGVYFNTSGNTTLSTSNTVYGNVIYGNGLSHLYGGRGMQSYSHGLTMSTFEGRRTNNYIVNNIIWGNRPADVEPTIFKYQAIRTNWIGNVGLPDPQFFGTNGIGYVFNSNNLPDFRIKATSPCIDAGTWLAYVTSPSGNGSSFQLDNSLYFSDGNHVVPGDTIQLQGQTNTATISTNDFRNNTIYFSPALTWDKGQGVSLPYSGHAPDMGAFEWTNDVASRPPPPVIKVITNTPPQ